MIFSEKFNMKDKIANELNSQTIEDVRRQDYVMRETALITYQKAGNRILDIANDNMDIADIGMNTGMVSFYVSGQLPSARICGLEENENLYKVANDNLNLLLWSGYENEIEFEQCSFTDLPLDDNSVDIVFSHGSLHLWADPINVLKECNRVCKKDGVVIIDDGNRWADEEHILFVLQYIEEGAKDFLNSLRSSYNINEVRQLLQEAGLDNWDVYENDLDLIVTSKKI